jgi:hypothetical protein
VPIGEGEVDHPEHRRQAGLPLVGLRNAQSDASVADLPFCAVSPSTTTAHVRCAEPK